MLSIGGYPDLPGMVLVDPVENQFEGQVVYLDFDGAADVTYNGPVVVEGIDIPAFKAPGELVGQEQAIIDQIVAELEETYAGTGIIFTTAQPTEGTDFSTVYIGGDDSAFEEYGDFLGLAETIDIGNQSKTDEAFVFANEFGPFDSIATAANALAHIVEHEAGHLICFAHENAPQETLEDFAYSGTVYWAARDFVEVANHHFIVINFSGLTPAWEQIQTLNNGSKALVVGGFGIDGYLQTDYYNGDDLQATNDWFTGGDFYGSWDPELHAVTPPSGFDFDSFSTTVYELTTIYDSLADYVLGVWPYVAQNCATFVNTMMAKAGVPETDRDNLGEFTGVDWGEENILPSGHFSYVTDIDSSDYSVEQGTNFTLTATTTATDALEKVDFYWDSDGNGSLGLYDDEKVGTDWYSPNGWGWDISTDDLAEGNHWFFAHAWDNQGDYSKSYYGIQINITLPDISPPTPNPSTWSTEPYATGTTSIKMYATSASDDMNGVQYYFDCTTSGGHDSGWQSSRIYEDVGLSPGMTYTYRVRTRDTSDNHNTGSYSISRSATTLVPPVADAGGPYYVNEGSTVTLSASGSYDPDDTIEYYFWDLDNDGQYDDASDVTTGFSQTAPGTYTVRVKVTDTDGLYATDSALVTVYDITPPTGSVSIAGAEEFDGNSNTLDSTTVRIDPAASDNSGTVAEMRYYLNGQSWGSWQSYSGNSFDVTLPQSVIDAAGSGPITVTIQYRDPSGNESAAYSDSMDITSFAPLNVTNLTDTVASDGSLSLREALLVTSLRAGETITFDASLFSGGPTTITLGGTQLEITGDVDIQGPGAEQLMIDANEQSRVFYVAEDVTAAIDGLSITGGVAVGIYPPGFLENYDGGGILNFGTLTVTNSTIFGNKSYFGGGGGIHNFSGSTLIVANSIISGNSANGYCGGGILNFGALTVTNSTISDNLAYDGGGISNGGTPRAATPVARMAIAGNLAASFDGVTSSIAFTMNITNSTISGNSAVESGGGISNYYGTLTVANTTFSGNSTGYDGGGIFNDLLCTLTVTNSTLSGNSTGYDGGGISNYDGTLTITNSILTLNVAASDPNYFGTLTPESSNNLIGSDPLFVRNPSDGGDGWGDNPDTPGVDEGANDDYGILQLRCGSSAIDAGSNLLALDDEGNLLETDIDGNPRILNGVVDIGAYELPVPLGDANHDGTVNNVDAAIVSNNWLTQSGATWADGDFNNDGRVDAIDATLMSANWQRTVIPPATSASAAVEPETVEEEPVSYDLDNDGQVGLGDLARFASVYRQQPGVATDSPDAYAADFDRSGTVDLGDLALFAANYQLAQANDASAGSVAPKTALSVAATPAILPGDSNLDGVVNDDDAAILASNWQKQSATWSEGDFDRDGKITDADVAILAQHWMMTAEDLDDDKEDDARRAVFAATGASGDLLGLLDE